MKRLVAITLLLLALTAPTASARLSTHQAERIAIHRIGPGTVVKHCWWFSATKDRCSYSTPAGNLWELEGGDIEDWTWESAITV